MGLHSQCSSIRCRFCCTNYSDINLSSAASSSQSREGALPSQLYQVGEELSVKENTNITLASIGADEVAFSIDAMTMQAFDVKMRKDSSDKESDGDDTDLDYGGNERVSVLSDKEDEEGEPTAKGAMVTPVTTKGNNA